MEFISKNEINHINFYYSLSFFLIIILNIIYSFLINVNLISNTLFVLKLLICTLFIWNGISLNLLMRKKININLILTIIGYCFLTILSAFFYHFISILYGAAIIESSNETFHFSLLLSVLTILPGFCIAGTDHTNWIRILLTDRTKLGIESEYWLICVFTLVGAWIGAFPIPLDWDRPWQRWPITCVIGAQAGYMAGLVAALLCLNYKYNKFKTKII